MLDTSYSLLWPPELFVWEARRVLELDEQSLIPAIEQLVNEAFDDEAVAKAIRQQIMPVPPSWPPLSTANIARKWLSELTVDQSRLLPRREPKYWAERQGELGGSGQMPTEYFASEIVGLIFELQDKGYFPRALPRECFDDPVDFADVERKIRSATKLSVEWPIGFDTADQLPQSTLFSLIEYFHDQAQRPRIVERIHGFSCGPHYGAHDRESGGVVYRWRVNALLQSHGVGLRLASLQEEKGRLVRHFDSALDDLADAAVEERADDPHDEVAHAIRDFRKRDAPLPQKRAALALLYKALEPRRGAIGATVTKKDESALFEFANAYAIRHSNSAQRTDYGEEYLDWMFWNYLSMIGLMEALERREKRPEPR